MGALKIVDNNYKPDKSPDEFDISDYDFNFDIEDNSTKTFTIVRPDDIEILRNEFKGDNRILLGYAKRKTGINNLILNEVYRNREWFLEIEVTKP